MASMFIEGIHVASYLKVTIMEHNFTHESVMCVCVGLLVYFCFTVFVCVCFTVLNSQSNPQNYFMNVLRAFCLETLR